MLVSALTAELKVYRGGRVELERDHRNGRQHLESLILLMM